MSADEPTTGSEGPRRFTRRQILALGAAGAGLLAFTGKASSQSRDQGPEGPPPRGQVVASLKHRGSDIRVERANGRRELYIDGEHIRTVNNTGEYRAAGFMFSPAPNVEELGRSIVDARAALAARGMQMRGRRMIP
jgi:hypothetical protein